MSVRQQQRSIWVSAWQSKTVLLVDAYRQVKRNKGKGGIDGMQVDELLPFLRENQETLIQEIRCGKYKPNPVRRVEIPKETKGEFRKLGEIGRAHV